MEYEAGQRVTGKKVRYGTEKHPITGMHFITGLGTAYPDYFLLSAIGIIILKFYI